MTVIHACLRSVWGSTSPDSPDSPGPILGGTGERRSARCNRTPEPCGFRSSADGPASFEVRPNGERDAWWLGAWLVMKANPWPIGGSHIFHWQNQLDHFLSAEEVLEPGRRRSPGMRRSGGMRSPHGVLWKHPAAEPIVGARQTSWGPALHCCRSHTHSMHKCA